MTLDTTRITPVQINISVILGAGRDESYNNRSSNKFILSHLQILTSASDIMSETIAQAKQKLTFPHLIEAARKMHACASPTLATPDAENSSISSSLTAFPKFVGKGTYGTVWKIDNENIKKVTRIFVKEHNDIVWSTLREICFHSAFQHSHIRPLTRIELYEDDVHVNLIMPDAGYTLSEWVKNTSFEVRLHIIPYIVIQILHVLAFLEKHGISHGDLKPWNIMINDSFHVFIIDWGAVCLNPPFHTENGCTKEFSAPELLGSVVQNSCAADIFSLGLIIRYLVYGNYETSDWILTQCFTQGFVPIMRWAEMARTKKSIDLIKCFQPLLSADPGKRPRASEIMQWKELAMYRHYLQQDEIHENASYNIAQYRSEDWNRFKSLTLQDRKTTITWFHGIFHKYYSSRFLPFAVELMDQYVIRKGSDDLNEKQLRFILLACFCISNSLFSNSLDHSGLISSKKDSTIFDQFRQAILEILNGLNWNIYWPMWNQKIIEPDGKAMLSVLLSDDVFGSSQEEKLTLYEKLVSDNAKKPTISAISCEKQELEKV